MASQAGFAVATFADDRGRGVVSFTLGREMLPVRGVLAAPRSLADGG